MEFRLALSLPRDELSVPVVRRMLTGAMQVLGVDAAVISDIEVALTEACTNVLHHAGSADEYEVSAGIVGDRCVIEVHDRGGGFDGSTRGLTTADPSAEEGRGIQLMRSLVDRVSFSNRNQRGTVVYLEKHLHFAADSILGRLARDDATPR